MEQVSNDTDLDALQAKLRADDGHSTPTYGDLLEAADAIGALRASLKAERQATTLLLNDTRRLDRRIVELQRDIDAHRGALGYADVRARAIEEAAKIASGWQTHGVRSMEKCAAAIRALNHPRDQQEKESK